jgi:MYXO-CTERM domain-containing protein
LKQLKENNMKLRPRSKALFAAAVALAVSALAAHAQLVTVNLSEQGTFAPFTGGVSNSVTNNGSFNTTEVISTGTSSSASPFTITYNPLVGSHTVSLNTGTINTATFVFTSPVTPLNYFTSLGVTLDYDFDNNGTIDLVQNYTLNLTPYTASNGLTAISYTIVPVQNVGTVMFNGQTYGYASVVSNSVGTLFDGSSTTAAIQFQFLSTPVPEPSTYALAGVLALGGIALLRRRRSQPGLMALAA